MLPEASPLMQHLLRDGAWIARLAGALVTEDWVDGIVELRPPPSDSANEAVDSAAIRLRMIDAVLGLPEPIRSAVILHVLEGKALDRVAAVTNTPKATVRMHVRRGIAQLKNVLNL